MKNIVTKLIENSEQTHTKVNVHYKLNITQTLTCGKKD